MKKKLLLTLSLVALLLPGSAFAKVFNVTDYGAVGDSTTINTQAIQKAIDAAATEGGQVVIPKGRFMSGSIFLKQGVSLKIEKDAVLLGSKNIEDYPKQNTRIEGHFEPWRMALVNASELENVVIEGEGTIDGNGIEYWAKFWQRRRENPKCTNLEVERPRMMFIDRCEGVKISGLTLKYSGFWNLHIYNSQKVIVDGVTILSPTRHPGHMNYMTPELLKDTKAQEMARKHPISEHILGPSTDGIDIDSSQHVIVRNSYISVNDDCIAIKGTKGPLAMEDKTSPPVEDILIENCGFGDGNGMLTCGSEATIVRNVKVQNCFINGNATLLTLKLRPDTPQHYQDITIENIELSGNSKFFNVAPWKQFFDLKGHEPPASKVSRVTIRNVKGKLGDMGTLQGNKGDMIENIVLENIDLNAAHPSLKCGKLQDSSAKDVKINGKEFNFPSH